MASCAAWTECWTCRAQKSTANRRAFYGLTPRQHYAWRTEKTYREWAWRLEEFIRPRDLESATGEDVKGF